MATIRHHVTRFTIFALLVSGCAGTSSGAAIAFTNQATGIWSADTGAGGTWKPDNGDHFYPVSGDTADFTNYNGAVTVNAPATFSGGRISAGGGSLVINSSLTLDTGTFTYSATNNYILIKGKNGVFINMGTFDYTANKAIYFRGNDGLATPMSGPLAFQNDGQLNLKSSFITSVTQLSLDRPTTYITNNGVICASTHYNQISGSVDAWLANTATGTLRADGASDSLTELKLLISVKDFGGTNEAINGGDLLFPIQTAGPGHEFVPATTFRTDTGNGSSVQLGGVINQLQGTIEAGSNVKLAEKSMAGQAVSSIDFGSTTLEWGESVNEGANMDVASNNVMELRSPINFSGASTYQVINVNASSTGTLRNVTGNTFTLSTNQALYLYYNVRFENKGTFLHAGGGNLFLNKGAPTAFINEGLYRAIGGSRLIDTLVATTVFDNRGTVEVNAISGATATTLTIKAPGQLAQWNSGDKALTGGTWRVMAGTNNATLSLELATNLTTVGVGAKVVLSEMTGASGLARITQLTTNLHTISGTLGLYDSMQFTRTNDLVVSGTLEFGLDGDELTTEKLKIVGNPTFTGGTVDIVNLGLVPGAYTLATWTGTAAGTLALGTVPDTIYAYTLTQDNTLKKLLLSVKLATNGTLILVR